MHLRDADDPGIERVQVARDDRLQRVDRVRGEQHRVFSLVRHRRMRALARRDDLEDVERAHQRPRAHAERARGHSGPVVHPVNGLHREPLEQALLDHHATAALVLLGRLEDEIRGAVEPFALRERARRGEQHRRVTVVAARVHLARHSRSVRHAGRLVDVQRVEIGTQANRRGRPSVAQHADHAGAGKPGVHIEAERAQLIGNEGARRRLLEGGLRMRVQAVTPVAHLGVLRGDFGNDVHGGGSAASGRSSYRIR